MRQFLPIKGPGGRAPTVKEKTALVVLSVTLILLVLTLLNGDAAFADEPARNPVFSIVGNLAQSTGVGILAAYAIVLLWSSLIFFKGERVAESRPLPGRAIATLGITIGLSGMLGIAQLDAAGSLGALVGGAIGNAFGSTFGVVVLLAMLLLGVHLAGQGAWAAFRGAPIGVGAGSIASTAVEPAPAPVSGGFSIPQANPRVGAEAAVVDDGDPTADERTLAVTQAMDEIERSHGVTIVEVEPEGLHEEEVIDVPHEETSEDSAEEPAEEPEESPDVPELEPEPECEPAEDEPELDWDSQQEAAEEEESEEAEPEALVEERPPSIGEEVDALAEPEAETEEAQVQAALDVVNSALVVDIPEETDDPAEDVEEELEEELDDDEEEAAEEEQFQQAKQLEEEAEVEEEEEDDLATEETEGEEEDDEWDDEAAVEEEDSDSSRASLPTIAQPYLFPVHRREADEPEEEPRENPEEDTESNDFDVAGDPDDDSGTPSESDALDAESETSSTSNSNFDWRGRPVE